MAYKIRKTKNFTRQRIASPKAFEPESFRTIKPTKDIRIIVGCPKGQYCATCPKRKKCRVGLKAQAILRRR